MFSGERYTNIYFEVYIYIYDAFYDRVGNFWLKYFVYDEAS